MHGWGASSAAILLSFSLAACATPKLQTPAPESVEIQREVTLQRRFAFKHQRDARLRLLRMAYRLTTAAHDFCGKRVTGATGLVFWSARDFSKDEQKLARAEYDIHDGLTVLAVMDGSPGEAAGVRVGDRLVSVEDFAIPQKTNRALGEACDRVKKAFDEDRPISLTLSRNGARQTVTVPLVSACDYPVNIARSEEINAFADGTQIFVTTGMMNFVKSDEELALVLGHELAHNFLGHLDAQRKNSYIGAGVGLAFDMLIVATTGYNPGFYSTGRAIGEQAFFPFNSRRKQIMPDSTPCAEQVMRWLALPISGVVWR